MSTTTTPSQPAADQLAVVQITGNALVVPSSAVPPPGVPLSPEEWGAMSETERRNALDFFREENASTTDGVAVTFPRIPYPTSGASFWEVPGLDGEPEARKTLEAVVVFKQPVRAWWPLHKEVGNDPPECSSRDGLTPDDTPGRQAVSCAVCQWSQWGTGKDGRGQACKARLQTFLLFGDEEVPTLLSLPPSALKTFAEFAVQLRRVNVPLIATRTVFGLTDAKSGGGIAYKALTLKVGPRLFYPEMVRARRVREAFEEHMRRRGIQMEETREESDEPRGGAVIYGESARVVVDEPGANDSPF